MSNYPIRPVERPRGVYDNLPDRYAGLKTIETSLSGTVTGYGYRFAETPVLEHTELFVRKSGGERLAQIYEFQHRGRDLALRPEHTASTIRMFLEQLQTEPLPVRLAYSGPVFRYEKPQAGRARQFTEFGCELIGANGLVADAETINVALDCLDAAGISNPQIVLGHIGVVLGFLTGLDLDQRAQDWLIWSMERLRRDDPGASTIPDHLVNGSTSPEFTEDIDSAIGSLDRRAVVNLLERSGVRFDTGSRSPEEIVEGMFNKHRRRYDPSTLQSATDFVSRLTELSGPPGEVLNPLRELVRSNGIDTGPLDDLEQVIDILARSRGSDVNINIDLGMGRGLRYYTGMLFEIYGGADGRLQLCGGGRYDDLARHLGARRSVPASGFSLGLERVLDAAGETALVANQPAILVWPGVNPAIAFRAAGELRAQGWIATIDPRDRSEPAARRWAQRQGYLAVANAVTNGMEITRLTDGETTLYNTAPTPETVTSS